MKLGQTIPALPVRNAAVAVDLYRDRLGFDESWRAKLDPEKPVCSGAESFIAGTASCRIQVEGVDELYEELSARDVFHPVSRKGVDDTDFGTREFATLDLDGNLVTFFLRVSQ